jgi:glycosyltransferase involved in cell wall biosynthesis
VTERLNQHPVALPAGKRIVMMGDDMAAAGGIATVARHYRDAGLFAQWPLTYLASYRQAGRLAWLRHAGLALWQLLGMLLTGRVALLHAHCASRGSFWRKTVYCAVARLFGVPYIIHLHAGEFPIFYGKESGRFKRALIRHTFVHAAAVIALSKKWQGWISETFVGAKVVTIGNPVSVGPVATGGVLAGQVLFMGRMYREKGVLDLIRACALASAQAPHLSLMLAGTASPEFLAEMKALAADMGISERVHFPGWVAGEAKARLLQQCEVFALPSYAEGLPLGLLEAMVAGKGVVTTPVGGIPDVVVPEVNGKLIAPGDVPALAQALAALLTDHARCAAMGQAARNDVAATFADSVVFQQLGQLYGQIIAA